MANCVLVSHPDLEKKNPRLKPVSQGMSIRVHLPIYFSLAYTTYPEKPQENFFVLGNVSCEATASLKLISRLSLGEAEPPRIAFLGRA